MYLSTIFIDPQQWTSDHVQSWLQSTIIQFKLGDVENIDQLFPEDGAALSLLTDDDFIKRIPQVIIIYLCVKQLRLYAQL